jgi:ribosomal protein L32
LSTKGHPNAMRRYFMEQFRRVFKSSIKCKNCQSYKFRSHLCQNHRKSAPSALTYPKLDDDLPLTSPGMSGDEAHSAEKKFWASLSQRVAMCRHWRRLAFM